MTAKPETTDNEPRTTNELTRRDLETQPLHSLHKARNWSKADVSLLEWPPGSGREIVVKDLARCPLWFRTVAGRRFLRREWRILRRLKELNCAPQALYEIDADAIGIEYCKGISTRLCQPEMMTSGVLDNIEAALAQVHARGVMHGDLHGDNILIGEDEKVTFIDWATAVHFGTTPRGWRARLFSEGRDLDRRAIAKLKTMHAPERVSAEERELVLGGGSPLYRNVKKLRRLRDRLCGRDRKLAAKQRMYQAQLAEETAKRES